MVDFRAGYVPPGVYVSADTSSVASAVGVSDTVICLVGPGLGYRSFIDHVTFINSTDTEPLTQLGINQSSVVVSSTLGGVTTTYTNGDDYTLVATNSSLPDSQTTISINQSGAIPVGQQIDVYYTYADANYFALNLFNDFASFSNVYGTPFNPVTGALQSPLSLAAQIAFQNGANRIYAVTPNTLGSVSDQYAAAYDLTISNFDIDLIVPVFATGTGSGYITDLDSLSPFAAAINSHLTDADNAGFPRNFIVGLPDNFSSAVDPGDVASTFANRRIVFAWPNQFNYFNSVLNITQVIGGSYLAAAYAGILANNPINQGLTRRTVSSITDIAAAIAPNQTKVNKDLWSSKGIAVLEKNRANQLVCRHGVTTDTSDVVHREFSIVRCQDALFTTIEQTLESAQLIGTPITAETPLAVKGIVAGAIETALASGVIQSYSNLAVRQQALPNGDPTVIECVFQYLPTYPLNYITVSFSLDLSTGTITTTTDSAGAPSGQ